MTRRKAAAPAPPEIAEGPNPDRGGAWYRRADGSLVRDRDEEQNVPEDEQAPVPDAATAEEAPAADTRDIADFAGSNEEGQ